MSIRIMSAVWDHSEQKGSPLLLLLALADHAADDGFCWPGVARLAHKIRMSERSVTRLLKTLEDDGDLYTIRQTGQHNWYVVRVGMTDAQVADTLARRGFTPDNLSPLTNRVDTPDKLSGGTDIATPEPLTQLCPPNLQEPSSNHQPEPSEPLRVATATPQPVNLAEWLEYVPKVKNQPALIRRFVELHYPDHEPPDYGFIGKTARKLGRGANGYKRLIMMLYQCEASPPKGDLLPYILAIAKRNNGDANHYREGHEKHGRITVNE